MSQCPNCNNQIGCSCQLRQASNGKTVCTACITNYENELSGITQKMVNTFEAKIEEIYIDLNGNNTSTS